MARRLFFEATFAAPPERVFDLLADLRGYDAWLPRSVVFKGTSEVSPGPIGAGTTYVERSIWGVRRGAVTRFERPSELAFDQPMTLNPRWLGRIEIRLRQKLVATDAGTYLTRELDLNFHGPVRCIGGAVAAMFATEIRRMIAALEQHIENPSAAPVNGRDPTATAT